jgi:hypothetical protein
MGWSALILIVTAWLPSACTRFSPPDRQRDIPAEQMVAGLRQTNTGLTRFKCVAKIICPTRNGRPNPFERLLPAN